MLPRLAAVRNLMNCGTEEYHASRSLELMLVVAVFAAEARALCGANATPIAAAIGAAIALLTAVVAAAEAAAAATWGVMVTAVF